MRRFAILARMSMPVSRVCPGRLLWTAACTLLIASSARADEAATPGLSLLPSSDSGLRSDLAWLVDRGVLDLPLGTWPMPSSTLRTAWSGVDVAKLDAADADALARVQRAVQRSTDPVRIAAAANSGRHPALDGSAEASGLGAGSLGFYTGGANWGGQLMLGATAETLSPGGPQGNLDGSYAVAESWGTVFAAGAIDRWWGPGRLTSPILSNAAPPIAGVIVRRASDDAPESPLLHWIGRWGYELSAGRLAHYDPDGTRTIGLRLYTKPWRNVEVGVSRSILWAGEGRPHDWVAFRDALLGRSNFDPSDKEGDPSDEVSGLDLRASIANPWAGAWVCYLHLVGEDEAGGLPTKLFGTIGLQFKSVAGQQRLEATLEATDTMPGHLFGLGTPTPPPAYMHTIYVNGYYQGGLPIGAAIGGGGVLYTFGLSWTPIGHPGQLRVNGSVFGGHMSEMGAQPINAAFGNPGRLVGLALGIEGETSGGLRWQLGVSVQQYPAGGRPTTSLLAGVELPVVTLR